MKYVPFFIRLILHSNLHIHAEMDDILKWIIIEKLHIRIRAVLINQISVYSMGVITNILHQYVYQRLGWSVDL